MDITVQEPLESLPGQVRGIDHELADLLARRRSAFAAADQDGQDDVYRYPIMAALVPVATSRGGEVAYPGDPMCLYSALISTVERSVVRRESGLPAVPHIDDVYPDWGLYPDLDYRLAACAPRTGLILDNGTTDGKIFDPRIWDDQAREQFVQELVSLQPRVVLLSSVSAGHRYSLEMAELAHEHSPGCLVVLGGRHADETVTYERSAARLDLAWSSTVEAVRSGRVQTVVDFVISGDGAPCLDLLLQAVSLCYRPAVPSFDIEEVLDAVRLIARQSDDLVGVGTIVGMTGDAAIAQPINGRSASPAERPSPYEAFSIRARFGVFQRAGSSPHGSRTAHVMTLDACPFKCTFCSESIAVRGVTKRFSINESEHVATRVQDLVDRGAEALFFDDPVFWGGNWAAISTFCGDLLALRGTAADHRPLDQLEWGAQLTVDVVLNRAKQADIGAALDLMRQAGCTYIYIGIESMAEQVMKGVSKNLLRRNPEPWVSKVRAALYLIRSHGIRVGSSVLFGLDGEDRWTIEETIEQIGLLIDDGLLIMASPNILTYHPGTAITRQHGRHDLDYHSRKDNRAPYTYFEEAYPEVVSKLLSEEDIWFIHEAAQTRWGSIRNATVEGMDAA